MNEKNQDGSYPLLEAIYNNNIEIVQLLIEYANQHQIILKLNEKRKIIKIDFIRFYKLFFIFI